MKPKSKSVVALYTALQQGYTVNKKGVLFNPKDKQVGGSLNHKGYLQTTIHWKGGKARLFFHQFVAFCKFGVKVFQTDCVRHLDGNKLNNSWSNIAVGSNSENQMDIPIEKRRLNTHLATEKARLVNTKYDHEQVIALRKEGNTYKEIMNITGVKSKSRVSDILKHSLLVTT